MRAVLQRVNKSRVVVGNKTEGEIDKGILIFLGIGKEDTEDDIYYLADKIIGLRIFEDENGKMNLSIKSINGSLLVVSQFTLFGDCRKGKRPSFDKAAKPEEAKKLYNIFIDYLKKTQLNVQTGKFQAMMDVEIVNDGPVTLMLDSKKEF